MEKTDTAIDSGDVMEVVNLPPPAAPSRTGLWIGVALAIAFALGIGATIWVLPRLERWWNPSAEQPVANRLPMVATNRPSSQAAEPLNTAAQQVLDGRVVQLENRLNHITVEAQAASGNAARAEGLLVAFAARRALDGGTPLGYVEGQLRLRFGQAQPRAVATIINAAQEPVTLVDLRAGLLDIAPRLATNPSNGNWWTALERESRTLITIRKSSTPSPAPKARLDRALRYIDSGRVSMALAEVERMPNREAADRWMQYARRYREARRALDLIETAAILEPRQLRSTEGNAVTQSSPLAP